LTAPKTPSRLRLANEPGTGKSKAVRQSRKNDIALKQFPRQARLFKKTTDADSQVLHKSVFAQKN
jgi:hypothetical protein